MMNSPVAMALVLGFVGFAAAETRANLLVNPGAEAGDLTGWVVGGSSIPFVDDGSFDPGVNPHGGRFDFCGGSGSQGILSQTVSLTGIPGITDSLIDSGLTSALVSFWEQGLNQGNPSDNGYVSLIFHDSSTVPFASWTSPVVDSHDLTWQNFTGVVPIPVGTRSIEYRMYFIRHVGSDLDTFFDDNSLSVVSSAVPEPASLTVLGTGGIAMLVYARRRKGGG